MKINLGNFGNNLPQPAGGGAAPPSRAFVTADALVETGDQLTRIAGHEIAQQRAEEEKRQKEADRVKSITAQATAKNALADLHDDLTTGMADGRYDKTKVGELWAERSQKVMSDSLAGVSAEHQELVRASLLDDLGGGQRKLRAAVDRRNQQDIGAGIGSYIEEMQRYAQRGDTERQEAIRNVDAFVRSAGPMAGLDPEKVGKTVQGFKEGVTFDFLNGAVSRAREDGKALDAIGRAIAGGQYADLDPAKRNALEQKVSMYQTALIHKQEVAAQRAAREQERVLRRAEAEFNTFQSLTDKGTALAPDYIERVTQATAGTPYASGIKALAQQAATTGGLASQPIRAQQATLDQIDKMIAQNGRTPELDERRKQVDKVLRGAEADLKADGLRAGLERGVIRDLAPIDTSTPEAFAASIGNRLAQSESVSMWAGKAVSPLDAKEAENVRNLLDALPPKAKAQAVATISGAVGPRAARAIAEQIQDKDRALGLAFATSGAQTTTERYTSELILKGAQAVKDGTAMKDDKKVTGWRAQIAQEIEGAFPDQRLTEAAKESAYYIAAGLAAENGGSVSASDLQRSVRLAIGGKIIERNGKRLPVAANLDASDFEKRLREVPASDVLKQAADGNVRVGGVNVPAADFAASIAGQELIYAGPNRYAVVVAGRPVTNTQGRPILIEVR